MARDKKKKKPTINELLETGSTHFEHADCPLPPFDYYVLYMLINQLGLSGSHYSWKGIPPAAKSSHGYTYPNCY